MLISSQFWASPEHRMSLFQFACDVKPLKGELGRINVRAAESREPSDWWASPLDELSEAQLR